MSLDMRDYILRTLMIAILAVVALLPIFAPDLFSDYALDLAVRFLIYLVLAEAWNLLAGYCGLVSLGSAAFVGLGAYIFFALVNGYNQPIAIALLGSAATGAVVAAMVSRAVFRLRGLFFTVGTLALAEGLRLFMINVPWFGGSTGFFLSIEFPAPITLYGWSLMLLLITEIVAYGALHTRVSVILRALRDDEDAAAQLGVRPFRVKLLLFAVASADGDGRRHSGLQDRGDRTLWNVRPVLVGGCAGDRDDRRAGAEVRCTDRHRLRADAVGAFGRSSGAPSDPDRHHSRPCYSIRSSWTWRAGRYDSRFAGIFSTRRLEGRR